MSISAIAATNSGQAAAYRPAGVADYLTVSLADVLRSGAAAPVFGGGYQHRMVSIDPDLAQRVTMVDRGGDATIQLASQLTAAVVRAAQEEALHTGSALVAAADIDLLSALGNGVVIDWAEHYQQVSQRENNAMFYPSIKAAPGIWTTRKRRSIRGRSTSTTTAWAGWWSWSAAGSTARRAFLISPTAPSLRASGRRSPRSPPPGNST